MVSFFSFLIIILYLVSSLDSIVTPPRDSTTIGDTFMACTDVAAIHPRPFSLLNREDNQSMVFNVTYSRPVFLAKPQNVAFMAGDSGLFTRIKNYHWGSATFLTSSHTELILTFNITMETLRMYRYKYVHVHSSYKKFLTEINSKIDKGHKIIVDIIVFLKFHKIVIIHLQKNTFMYMLVHVRTY